MTGDEFDVFISYSWRAGADGVAAEVGLAETLHNALDRAGLRVWRDVDRIQHGDAIHAALEDGIRRSTIVVPLLSAQHQASNVCRWELICALAYAPVGGRLLPVFPITLEGDGIPPHYPPGVFDGNVLPWDGNHAALDSLCERIREHVIGVRAQGGARPETLFEAGLVGAPGVTGNRFVGRLPDVLRLYGRLLGGLAPAGVVAMNHAPVQLLRGEPGMGKSSLAAFFAERFSGRYERGVLWLNAAGDQVDAEANTPAKRDGVLRSLSDGALRWLRTGSGSAPTDLPLEAEKRWEEVRELIRERLAEQGGHLLVVIDDVPRGVPLTDLTVTSAAISTLITSRSDHLLYEGVEAILVDQFAPFESMLVLDNARDPGGEARRRGEDPWRGQIEVARELTSEVGHHPMAVDLLGLRLLEPATQPSELLAEIRTTAPEFLDVAHATLPLGHSASIVATVGGSLRSAVGHNPSRAAILRMLSVAPAGRQVPQAALEHGLASTGMSGVVDALDQLSGRGLLRRRTETDDPYVTLHQVIRAVARELWRRSSDPFAAGPGRPREPDLCWALAHWHHVEGERLRNADDVKAADVHGVALHVLAEGESEGPLDRAQALHRLYGLLAQARLTYRAADRDSLEDYEAALSVIDAAEAAIEPFRGRPEVEFGYQTAEAMRGLVRSNRAPYLGGQALAESRAAMDLTLAADDARQKIAEQLLAMPPDECPLDHAYIRDVLARSRFNVPGRVIRIVKALRTERPDDWATEARRLLQGGADSHREVLAMRRALWVDRIQDPSNILSLAASESGIGMMKYYEALLPGSREERLMLLDGAVPQIGMGLWMRDDAAWEPDVIKSLALMLKALMASLCLRGDVQVSMFAQQHEQVCLSVEQALADFVGRPYVPVTDPPSPAFRKRQAWRDALRFDLDTIGSDVSGADEALLLGCRDTVVGWLALAKITGVTKGAFHFAEEFFDEDLEHLVTR